MLGDDPREALRSALRASCSDARVIDAVIDTPRDLYVADGWRAHAWDDRALPLAEGQTISQPTMVAIMTEALEPRSGDVALDVGTGSGYQAAVLSRLVARVYGIERLRGLACRAQQRLAMDPGARAPVRVVAGDAWRGFPGRLLFDVVVVAAAAGEIPPALAAQLTPGGRLVAPIGPPGGVQELVRLRRRADGRYAPLEQLGGCVFVPLVRAS